MVLQLLLDHTQHISPKGVQNLGMVMRLGVLGFSLVLHDKRRIRRQRKNRQTANYRLNVRVPNNRLHISGEYYVH